MKHQYFSQKEFNSMEKQMHELMELNAKTFQGISYFSPVELFSLKKPEDFIEKNMMMFIHNSHKGLDYMQNLFNIMEKQWLHASDNLSDTVKQSMSHAQLYADNSLRETKHAAQVVAKKATSTLKTKAKAKLTQSSVHKPIKSIASTTKKVVNIVLLL